MRLKPMTVVALLLAIHITLFAAERKLPFKDGETLTYAVSYRAALVPNTEVAEVVFRTTRTTLDDEAVFHVYANARCYPFFRWFYDLNDTYQVWFDTTSLRPVKFTGNLEEGKYRFVSKYLYNWDSMVINTKYRNLKRPNYSFKNMKSSNNSYDALSLFYNLRAKDITADFTAGRNEILELVLEDTIRKVNYKYLGREVKNIKGLGKFKTLKFSCQLATSTGESFEDGTEFFLWISDDKNKIPLYIESPIKVGSIRGKLIKYTNLAYPLDSKLN